MKKLGYLFLSMVLLAAASCGSRSSNSESEGGKAAQAALPTEMTMEEAMQTIEIVNSQCPINLGMANNVGMQGVAFEDSILVYRYTVARIVEDFKDNPQMKEFVVQTIKEEAALSPANKLFMNTIANSGVDLMYVYHSEDGDSASIQISNKELKEAIKDLKRQ